MDNEKTIRSLKKQLLIERIAFGVIVLVLAVNFAAGKLSGGKSMIMVDGKPVVCVDSEKEAHGILERIKSDSGANPLETEFRQEVSIARAPRNASPMPTSRAMTVARNAISPVVNRWSVIADGKAVVGLPSKQDAAKTLEMAKIKFGSQAKNLAEEPQIRENVSIAKAAISPEQFQKTPEDAVKFLFTPREPTRKNSTYIVRPNDVAVSIAKKLDLAPGELKKLNPGVNLDRLAIGDTLQVKESTAPVFPLTIIVRDQISKTESVPPPMVRVSSPNMYSGKTAFINRGRSGKRTVDIAVIYENGRRVGDEVISEQVLATPVPGKIAVGIKPRP